MHYLSLYSVLEVVVVVMVPRSFPPLSHALLVSGAERERERCIWVLRWHCKRDYLKTTLLLTHGPLPLPPSFSRSHSLKEVGTTAERFLNDAVSSFVKLRLKAKNEREGDWVSVCVRERYAERERVLLSHSASLSLWNFSCKGTSQAVWPDV